MTPGRILLLTFPLLWLGATLLLSELRWFARRPLAERVGRYLPGGATTARTRGGLFSVESFRDVVGPLSRVVGERLSRVFGVTEPLDVRLRRIHSPLDVTDFRVRQVGLALAGFGIGTLLALVLPLPLIVRLVFVLACPLLAFLVLEQQIALASRRWQRRLFLELPVVSEQLAMLLSSGYSLTAALNRIAERGHGCCAQDLRRVLGRIRQGLSDIDALREWAALADVEALHRLVPVLALNRQASDLGSLISQEARAIRRDVQRELVERVERRGQEVWIPVTVSTLVPGVIFMAIPFIEALRLFST